MMTKYAYKLVFCPYGTTRDSAEGKDSREESAKMLNTLGEQGWELFSVTADGGDILFTLRRSSTVLERL